MARVLVLGATGHIGAHIVRALLADRHAVRAAYRRPNYLSVLEGLEVERVPVDTEQPQAVTAAAQGCDWVFHAAGYYPPFGTAADVAILRAVESTRRVLEALRAAHPARIVFTSSAAVIRREAGGLATEEDVEPRPSPGRTVYTQAKIAMDHEAHRAAVEGLPLVTVNPSVCLGEYDAHPFSGLLILAYAKLRVPWYLEHQLNAVYTGDVAVGHVRAAERGRIGERYLLAGETWHARDLARLIAETAGVPAPRWRLPLAVAEAAGQVSQAVAWVMRTRPLIPRDAVRSARHDQLLDPSKARQELGLPQTPVREAVRRAVAWFKAHGYC